MQACSTFSVSHPSLSLLTLLTPFATQKDSTGSKREVEHHVEERVTQRAKKGDRDNTSSGPPGGAGAAAGAGGALRSFSTSPSTSSSSSSSLGQSQQSGKAEVLSPAAADDVREFTMEDVRKVTVEDVRKFTVEGVRQWAVGTVCIDVDDATKLVDQKIRSMASHCSR